MASFGFNLIKRLNPDYVSACLFALGLIWLSLLGSVCVTCGELKPRGTFLSEPTLLPGAAWATAINEKFIVPSHLVHFPSISPNFRGRLVHSQFASDRRETVCLVASTPMGEDTFERGEEYFARLAYMVEHDFRWLARDVLFLLIRNSNNTRAREELSQFLHQYMFNHTDPTRVGRNGPITSAIVFEISKHRNAADIVRVHGRNGKLPNMDLINTVILSTNTRPRSSPAPSPSFLANDNARDFALGMLRHGAHGDGLHAVFLDFGIQALTVQVSNNDGAQALVLNRMETILRCLSNLGERFNRSFMFYIMLHSRSFVSVDEYLWALCLLLAPLAVNAFARKSLMQAYLFSLLLGLGVCHLPLALLCALAVLPPIALRESLRRRHRGSALLLLFLCSLPLFVLVRDFSPQHEIALFALITILLPATIHVL